MKILKKLLPNALDVDGVRIPAIKNRKKSQTSKEKNCV